MGQKPSLGKILGFCILLAGGLIFAVSLFFGIADFKEGSFGGFMAIQTLLIFWPIAIGLIIAAVIILESVGAVLSFKKPKVLLFSIIAIFAVGFLIFYLSYLNSRINAVVTQKQFFAQALPDTEWVKEKIPLYFVSREQLCVINVDGSEQKIIFEKKGIITDFILSSDGKFILVIVRDPSRSLAIDRIRSLYLVRLGNDETVLIDEGISDSFGYIQWSPDGQSFFYLKYFPGPVKKYSGSMKMYVFNTVNNEKKVIELGTEFSYPGSWAKDGKNIYYWTRHSKYSKISLSDLESKPLEGLSEKEQKALILSWRGNQSDSAYRYRTPADYKTGFVKSSDGGAKVEMNYRDYYLYYSNREGIKKKIFSIKRKGEFLSFPRLVLAPGEGKLIVISNPGHPEEGIFVYEPLTGRLGRLLNYPDVSLFGFYDQQ